VTTADALGIAGGILALISFPFGIYKAPLWLAITNHSQRRYEQQLKDMDAPDFVELQKGRMRIWICVSLYFMATALLMAYMPIPVISFVPFALSFAAVVSAGIAASYAGMADPRQRAKNRARIEKIVEKKRKTSSPGSKAKKSRRVWEAEPPKK
jgi:hypothetical protein